MNDIFLHDFPGELTDTKAQELGLSGDTCRPYTFTIDLREISVIRDADDSDGELGACIIYTKSGESFWTSHSRMQVRAVWEKTLPLMAGARLFMQ